MRELLRNTVLLLSTFAFSNISASDVKPSDSEGAGSSSTTKIASQPTYSAASKLFRTDNATCPSRTANYITHTLAQQCLRTDRVTVNATKAAENNEEWSLTTSATADGAVSSSGTVAGPPLRVSKDSSSESEAAAAPDSTSDTNSEYSAYPTSDPSTSEALLAEPTTSPKTDPETDSPLDNANFLSFEEWKKQNVEKVDDQARNLPTGSDRQRPGINNALESLGDEGEIELDFSGFGGSASGPRQHQAAYRAPDGATPGQTAPATHTPRSKDAGKTCKERTNYASFDCAATILKNNPECKSASSILVENKDSYMLNTCSAGNKFLIVELCNDILIDTVVLANYEFFSSIFRHFRISVSDRYPVKMDKWRDLGTFEARNTREVQAFLVEHPQIWTRYLRIEFLSHYGSEYYCPLSLLRVHGTTMLEELRPHEEATQGENAEDEQNLKAEATAEPVVAQEEDSLTDDAEKSTLQEIKSSPAPQVDTVASLDGLSESISPPTGSEMPQSSASALSSGESQPESMQSPALAQTTELSETTCAPNINISRAETSSEIKTLLRTPNEKERDAEHGPETTESVPPADSTSIHLSGETDASLAANGSSTIVRTNATHALENVTADATTTSTVSPSGILETDSTATSFSSSSLNSTGSISKTVESASSGTSTSTNFTRAASSASTVPQPQPSTQESFFKSIQKRLQQLESNSTLSLQYIEEQSRILRDAFSKVERRQISTTSSFLTTLNETVMTELHGFRQAYDQIWQSTVIELEGQREQYQREMLAMSARLTMVADELVWQKRMGIVQSTLLLLCLGLVLFARPGNGYLEGPFMQQVMHKSQAALSRAGWESPLASPSPEGRSPVAMFRRKLWRSHTDPAGGSLTDGTDSRPETKDGPEVNVELPTPPGEEAMYTPESDDEPVAVDGEAEDEDETLDLRRVKSEVVLPPEIRTSEVAKEPPDLTDDT